MSESVEAVYENGVFRPLSRIILPEGERVHLTIVSSADQPCDPAWNLAELAEETGLADLATNIDHYLYGLPEQRDDSTLR
ncbi:MAG: antitoxin family protein [Blastocatellia bacterium]